MRVIALANVLKVVLSLTASVLLAAVISPYLHEIGKNFATSFKRSPLITSIVAALSLKFPLGVCRTDNPRR